MSNYYDGLNQKLLAAIPADAKHVLELGCANGRLGQRFKELHPGVSWWGVEMSAEAAATAAQHRNRSRTGKSAAAYGCRFGRGAKRWT